MAQSAKQPLRRIIFCVSVCVFEAPSVALCLRLLEDIHVLTRKERALMNIIEA